MTGDDFRPERFRPGRRSRFKTAQTAQWALLMQALSDAGYRTYSLMCAHVSSTRDDTDVWPQQKTLAQMMGKRPEAVSRVVNKELIPLGLIEVDTERYGHNNTLRRNIYTVHEEPPPGWEGVASLQEWYAARKKEETSGQPGDAKNRVSGRAKNRAPGDAKDRANKRTKVDLDEREGAGVSVRPPVQVVDAGAPDGRTDGGESDRTGDGGVPGAALSGVAADAAAVKAGGPPPRDLAQVDTSPGVRLLMDAADNALRTDLLRGTAMRDQGLAVAGLLEAGYSAKLLHEVIAHPMPDPVTTSLSAVIAGRLRKLAQMPVPGAVPQQAVAPTGATDISRWQDSTPTPPRWEEQADRLRRGVEMMTPCDGCEAAGRFDVLAVVGETMCAACLGWPTCPGKCSRHTRDGALCSTCEQQAVYARLAEALPVVESEDGTCPGHEAPCGRSVPTGSGGLCARCRVASQRDRDRIVREWEQSVAAAVTAVEKQEHQAAHATS
ncbi:hypothetical protein AB0D73_35295 [Streptomyces sp. NPDC048215]|uniref:hypothetical protein n=1 Tax=Streptomyces sp. NPDC048215 TaxID=3156690 RepID=UPI0033F3B1C4